MSMKHTHTRNNKTVKATMRFLLQMAHAPYTRAAARRAAAAAAARPVGRRRVARARAALRLHHMAAHAAWPALHRNHGHTARYGFRGDTAGYTVCVSILAQLCLNYVLIVTFTRNAAGYYKDLLRQNWLNKNALCINCVCVKCTLYVMGYPSLKTSMSKMGPWVYLRCSSHLFIQVILISETSCYLGWGLLRLWRDLKDLKHYIKVSDNCGSVAGSTIKTYICNAIILWTFKVWRRPSLIRTHYGRCA